MPLILNASLADAQKQFPGALSREAAAQQDIRPLRVGLVNLMPDTAFLQTEIDFLKPIHAMSASLQIELILLAAESIKRLGVAAERMAAHYQKISKDVLARCDMVILSGANVLEKNILESEIGAEIVKIYQQSVEAGVTTVVASCLSTHAILEGVFGIKREPNLDERGNRFKLFGAFEHEVTQVGKTHPLTRDLNARFDFPYSRWNRTQSGLLLAHSDLEVLAASTANLVASAGEREGHLIVSKDFQFVGLQGHPEYAAMALFKEWRRDFTNWLESPSDSAPPALPKGYLTAEGERIIQNFQSKQIMARREELEGWQDEYLESREVEPHIRTQWHDTGNIIFSRIVNLVYKITGFAVGQRLDDKQNLDPKNPLKNF